MEHQSLLGISASASGPHCSTGIKEEPEDDASQTIEKHSADEYDKKKLDIHIAYTTTLSVSDFNEKDTLKEKLELNSGGELFGLEVKNENSSDVSDCKQDSNLTRDHLPATTNIVQDSNLTRDHLPATTNIVQDSNLTRDHLPATTNIVQDSNLTRDHLPATTNIVQDSNLTRDHLPATTNIVQDSNLTRDHLPATTNIVQDSNLTRDHLPATTNIVQDSNLTRDHLPATTNIVQDSNLTKDHLPATTNIVQDSNLTRDHLPATTNIVQGDNELNQLTEVAGEMDCKDGIRNGNSNHLLVGRVIPTDVEAQDQEQLARDMESSDDIEGMSLLYCMSICCKIGTSLVDPGLKILKNII